MHLGSHGELTVESATEMPRHFVAFEQGTLVAARLMRWLENPNSW
jgi:hypothetical protein